MAIRFAVYSTPILNLSHASAKGPRNSGLLMCANNPVSVSLQIRSYDHLKNKVIFEDRSAGIVCYKDENGEIICEDYDEGPRLHHHQISRFTCNSSRDVEIIDLLQRCWKTLAADEKELKSADSSRAQGL